VSDRQLFDDELASVQRLWLGCRWTRYLGVSGKGVNFHAVQCL